MPFFEIVKISTCYDHYFVIILASFDYHCNLISIHDLSAFVIAMPIFLYQASCAQYCFCLISMLLSVYYGVLPPRYSVCKT
jgi:hypothetical protein